MPIVSANDTRFDVDVVVFDKDGTLVDLDALWYPAARGWIDAIARDDVALGELLADRLGIDLGAGRLVPDGIAAASTFDVIKSETAEALQAQSWSEDRIEVALQSAVAASDAATSTEAAATLVDVPALFSRLSAGGVRVAVLTSADRASTVEFLAQIGADRLVAMVVTASDVEHPKPHPQGLDRIAERLLCRPDRILMVGDSVFDHRAARAAGARFVAVGHQAGAADGADASVESVDDITVG